MGERKKKETVKRRGGNLIPSVLIFIALLAFGVLIYLKPLPKIEIPACPSCPSINFTCPNIPKITCEGVTITSYINGTKCPDLQCPRISCPSCPNINFTCPKPCPDGYVVRCVRTIPIDP